MTPDKHLNIDRRKVMLGGASSLTLLSILTEKINAYYKQLFFNEKDSETIDTGFSGVDNWETVKLSNGVEVDLCGVVHTVDSLKRNLPFILKKIKSVDIVDIEGVMDSETSSVISSLSFIGKKDLPSYLDEINKISKADSFSGFFGSVAALAFSESKDVLCIEVEHNNTVLDVIKMFEPLYVYCRLIESDKIKAWETPIFIDFLTNVKGLFEFSFRKLLKTNIPLSNEEWFRFMYDLHDWRDASLAVALHRLIKLGKIPENKKIAIFRGAAHGSNLHHYLKSPREAELKFKMYPQFEFLFDRRKKDDIAVKVFPDGSFSKI